jgi:fibrillarin-like rRNA methylase
MNILKRVLKSLHDGSFAIKILNRVSKIKYVPESSVTIDEYISKHYQGEGWKTLSVKAKKAWVQFSPIFKKYEIQTIAYVGANIGTTALALDEAFPGCNYYLLEPIPQVFEELVKNTSQKQNMHCVNIAAGAKKDRRNMFVDNYFPASSFW